MPVDSSIFGELTMPFRFVDNVDNAVLANFPLARSVEVATLLSDMADAETIATERFDILREQRRRFLVVVKGTDFITLNDFAGVCPRAILRADRWGLEAGRTVAIVKFAIDYGLDTTQLLVWG